MSRYARLVLLLVLVLAIAACRREEAIPDLPTPAGLATATETTGEGAIPTPGSSTATAVPPEGTAAPSPTPLTVIATSTAAPSPLSSPTLAPAATVTVAAPVTTPPPAATAAAATAPAPGGAPMRISFAAGAAAASVNGTLVQGGDTDVYQVRALAGQTMTVEATSSVPGLVVVSITDQTGGTLAVNSDGAPISAALPSTGDYNVNLTTPSGAGAVTYILTVSIPPSGGQQPGPTRISFPAGGTAATVEGLLNAGGGLQSYVIRVLAGQTLLVSTTANPAGPVTVYVRDPGGALIASGPDGAAGLSVPVGTTGDYTIDVTSAGAAPAVAYRLTAAVPPVQPTAAAGQPVRIAFAPGASSATQTGTLAAGARAAYVLYVLNGQTLIANLSGAPAGQLDILIRNASGEIINLGGDPTELGTGIQVSGDYTIEIGNPSAGPVQYTLVATVPPAPSPGQQPVRIEFPAGGTSATVNGDLAIGGDLDTYVIRSQAGQTMVITIAPSQAGWLNLFVYNSANQLIGSGTDQTGVAVPTVTTGDYTILVGNIGAGPAITYVMTVTIR